MDAAITPHVRPPTTIGQPTDERMPSAWFSRAIGPDSPSKLSTRPGRPVFATSAAMLVPLSAKRMPTAGRSTPLRLQAATTVTVPPRSKRSRRAMSASHCSPTSRVTASKTSAGAAARATSVATRRRAACSASRRLRSGHVTPDAVDQALVGNGPRRPWSQRAAPSRQT